MNVKEEKHISLMTRTEEKREMQVLRRKRIAVHHFLHSFSSSRSLFHINLIIPFAIIAGDHHLGQIHSLGSVTHTCTHMVAAAENGK
jgi:hypothetical protein